ncbi:MAG TPA: amidohydrolase family protein, partial [Phycisphaerales bacterium]|nr:amidohydrolase family protein [Phycisphaerales bacterium]
TELHDMLATEGLARILLDLEHRGELTQRIRLYATRENFDALFAMTEPLSSRGAGVPPVSSTGSHSAPARLISGSRLISLDGLKIFTDGTLNSRTAHMLHPFNDPIPDHSRGTPMMSRNDIAESIALADSHGLPIAAHAIGDAAVRTTLDAIERVKPKARGQRIEHAQFVDEADIPRFARLNVIASMQPCHLLTDIEAIERFAPRRAHRAFPLRDLIDAAKHAGHDPARLIFLGSDAPIVPPDPADNLQAAVHRRRAGMPPDRAIAPQQAITHEEAVQLSRPAMH